MKGVCQVQVDKYPGIWVPTIQCGPQLYVYWNKPTRQFLGFNSFFYFFHFNFSSSIPVIIYILPPIRRTYFNNSFNALFNSPCFMYKDILSTQFSSVHRYLDVCTECRTALSYSIVIYICRLLHRDWKRQRDTFIKPNPYLSLLYPGSMFFTSVNFTPCSLIIQFQFSDPYSSDRQRDRPDEHALQGEVPQGHPADGGETQELYYRS